MISLSTTCFASQPVSIEPALSTIAYSFTLSNTTPSFLCDIEMNSIHIERESGLFSMIEKFNKGNRALEYRFSVAKSDSGKVSIEWSEQVK